MIPTEPIEDLGIFVILILSIQSFLMGYQSLQPSQPLRIYHLHLL